MKPRHNRLNGSVLPTAIAATLLMLTAVLGLMSLWEHETLRFARSQRLRQARADAESAYLLYRLHPDAAELTATEGYLLDDSLPQSRVFLRTEPWGLYETVHVATADSLLCVCRLFGAAPETANTLFYADNRSAVTLAGQTILKGSLQLPQNGLIYGRVGADFYRGAEIPHTAIRRAPRSLPTPDDGIETRLAAYLTHVPNIPAIRIPDSLAVPFSSDSAVLVRLGDAEISECTLRGKIVIYADELRIDSACRMEHLLVIARKITVGSGARITAQLFARDTVIVETRSVLEYPSGIYAGQYAEIGARSTVNGYAIVRDTVRRKKAVANFRQDRTARLRGLLWVEGTAQLQGIVSGRAVVQQAAYFSPKGYYKEMLYDVAILENPVTAQPLWLKAARRKEAACID